MKTRDRKEGMMAKHTPGPWTPHGSLNAITDSTHRIVASVNALRDEAEANARLIAAAPDLLKRLKVRVVDCPCVGDVDFPTDARCEECRADIAATAKAEDEPCL